MKNIIYTTFLLFSFTIISFAQSDFNGRDKAALAKQQKVEPTQEKSTLDPTVAPGYDKDEGHYEPNDLFKKQAEKHFLNSEDADLLLDKLTTLEEKLMKLTQQNEQLQFENQTIRRSLGSCCQSDLTTSDERAFLLQTAPNPFTTQTTIQFFVPESAQSAEVQIRNLEGIVLKSFSTYETGLNEIELSAEQLAVGSYIYTLTIDNQMVDSKVMILAKNN